VKSKAQVQEAIPPAFAKAMQEVVALIESGDDTISIESDDLIQIGDVCGGLYNAGEQRFGFCLCIRLPDGEAIEDQGGTVEWYFYLSRDEIAKIATGAVSSLRMWRCSPYDCGRRWSQSDGYCPHCDFPP